VTLRPAGRARPGSPSSPRRAANWSFAGRDGAEATARLLLAHKPAVMSALATDWRNRHREALAHWSAFRPLDEAGGLAWGELEERWHKLRGARASEWQCAGCGEPIGGRAARRLADHNRLHLAGSLDCLFV
jgi:hypothetical protein